MGISCISVAYYGGRSMFRQYYGDNCICYYVTCLLITVEYGGRRTWNNLSINQHLWDGGGRCYGRREEEEGGMVEGGDMGGLNMAIIL